MTIVGKDNSIQREFIKKQEFLIKEYELVKSGKHTGYRFVADFYRAHNLKRQNFIKYYNRFKNGELPIPQKRGPKWKTRRIVKNIEDRVLELRDKGNNRYEIHNQLLPDLKEYTPSPSGVYNVLKRHNKNVLNHKMKEEKRKIITKKAGELGHIDCHYLEKGIIDNYDGKLYLVGLIDDYSRLAWVEIVKDITSLNIMFATLKGFTLFKSEWNISFI